MIESRYKIEYVLPATEEPTSNKVKLISFILLTPVALLIAAAIAYGLGYKSLPKEALEIFTTLKQDVSEEIKQAGAKSDATEKEYIIATAPEVTAISETGISDAPDMNIPALPEEEADLPEDVVILDTQVIAPSASMGGVDMVQNEATNDSIENTNTVTASISNDTAALVINPAVEKIEEMMLKDIQHKQEDANQQALEEAYLEKNSVEHPDEIQPVMENEQALNTQEVIQKSDTNTLTELEAVNDPIENTNSITASISNNSTAMLINPAVEKIEEMMLKDNQQKQAKENLPALEEASFEKNAEDQPDETHPVMENKQSLDTQEVIQKSDTETLAELIDNSLKNISKNDQDYIAALNNSIVTKSSESTEKIVPLNLENSVKSEKAAEAPKQSTQTVISYNNSVSFSSSISSPVDAIIAAMQGIQATPLNQASNSNADLQNKLNQLIKDDTTKTGVLYRNALDQEYRDRSNETRSIIVNKGDTLWNIAVRAYGNGNEYPKILKSNPQLSEANLKQLTAGQILRVPL